MYKAHHHPDRDERRADDTAFPPQNSRLAEGVFAQANAYRDVRQGASDDARGGIACGERTALLEAARGTLATLCRDATRDSLTHWGFLIRDLSDPANDPSADLKGTFVVFAIGVIREADAMFAGRSETWSGRIDINRTVREGLTP